MDIWAKYRIWVWDTFELKSIYSCAILNQISSICYVWLQQKYDLEWPLALCVLWVGVSPWHLRTCASALSTPEMSQCCNVLHLSPTRARIFPSKVPTIAFHAKNQLLHHLFPANHTKPNCLRHFEYKINHHVQSSPRIILNQDSTKWRLGPNPIN